MKTRRIIVLFIIALGTFMSGLDTSAVSVVLPLIQESFQVSMTAVEWGNGLSFGQLE